MRLLLVSDSARIHNGGANRVVVETCGLLAARGHQVAIAHVNPGTSEVDCPTFLLPRDNPSGRLTFEMIGDDIAEEGIKYLMKLNGGNILRTPSSIAAE